MNNEQADQMKVTYSDRVQVSEQSSKTRQKLVNNEQTDQTWQKSYTDRTVRPARFEVKVTVIEMFLTYMEKKAWVLVFFQMLFKQDLWNFMITMPIKLYTVISYISFKTFDSFSLLHKS